MESSISGNQLKYRSWFTLAADQARQCRSLITHVCTLHFIFIWKKLSTSFSLIFDYVFIIHNKLLTVRQSGRYVFITRYICLKLYPVHGTSVVESVHFFNFILMFLGETDFQFKESVFNSSWSMELIFNGLAKRPLWQRLAIYILLLYIYFFSQKIVLEMHENFRKDRPK